MSAKDRAPGSGRWPGEHATGAPQNAGQHGAGQRGAGQQSARQGAEQQSARQGAEQQGAGQQGAEQQSAKRHEVGHAAAEQWAAGQSGSGKRRGQAGAGQAGAGQAGRETNPGWSIVSYLVAGMALYGGIGWLIGRWTGFSAVLLPVGLLVGLGLALTLIIFRYGRS
jgi:ATP synthase protein I